MVNKQKIVVLAGNTGTGKSLVSSYLKDHHRFVEFVPFRFYKKFLEEMYSCPNLDTIAGKEFVPAGMKIDMQQYMVNFFHFAEENDPFFTTRKMSGDLPYLVATGSDIVISSVRPLGEINFLLGFLEKTYDPELVCHSNQAFLSF